MECADADPGHRRQFVDCVSHHRCSSGTTMMPKVEPTFRSDAASGSRDLFQIQSHLPTVRVSFAASTIYKLRASNRLIHKNRSSNSLFKSGLNWPIVVRIV